MEGPGVRAEVCSVKWSREGAALAARDVAVVG